MASNKYIPSEDISELLQENMQMTADGFDRLETRMGSLENKTGYHKRSSWEAKRPPPHYISGKFSNQWNICW